MAPRDCYDIWYLTNNVGDIDWQEVEKAFQKKSNYKGLSYTNLSDFISEHDEQMIQQEWDSSLGNQIKEEALPGHQKVITCIKSLLKEHIL